ncbi:MAG: YceI family protein [Gammaproteobacteria bacterium]
MPQTRLTTLMLLSGLLMTGLLLPELAAAARYKLDPDHTFPSLEFSHMGLSVWRGKFNRTSGTFEYDKAAGKGTVNVSVETASIDFGLDSMQEYAIKPDWLDVAKHPVMTYAGNLVFQGGRPVTVDGQLTLRGVTRPLQLTINSFSCIDHPFYKKEVCGADAWGVLNRADFGMTQFAEGEAGKVRLLIQVEAIRED